jgi:hypothetical protein
VATLIGCLSWNFETLGNSRSATLPEPSRAASAAKSGTARNSAAKMTAIRFIE